MIKKLVIIILSLLMFGFFANKNVRADPPIGGCDPTDCTCNFLSCLCTGDCDPSDPPPAPTPPPGGGSGGCWQGAVNCPAGGTISLGQPLNTFCSRNEASAAKPICGTGSAQKLTGVCCGNEDDDGFCGNPQITTYACCGPGESEVMNQTQGGNYSNELNCFNQNPALYCNDGDDRFQDLRVFEKLGGLLLLHPLQILKSFKLDPPKNSLEMVEINLKDAIQLAGKYNIYAYDAYILQCAIEQDIPLISLDKNLIDIAIKVGVQGIEV